MRKVLLVTRIGITGRYFLGIPITKVDHMQRTAFSFVTRVYEASRVSGLFVGLFSHGWHLTLFIPCRD